MTALTPSVHSDLISFLSSPRPDLRLAAASATLAALATDAQHLVLLGVVRPLCQLASGATSSSAEPRQAGLHSLTALHLLCSYDQLGNQCVLDLVDCGGVGRLVELALSGSDADIVHLACAILANATRAEEGSLHFIGVSVEPAKPTATLLLAKFLEATNSPKEGSSTDDSLTDPYQHLAAVFMNITQLQPGQDFFMKLIPTSASTTTSHLQMVLPQLTSPNVHRRRGVAGILKNCCFSQDSTWWLLHVVHIDKTLLLPLAGPEELTLDEKVGLDPDFWLLGPHKRREPDPLVRLLLVEAVLLLLASGRRARETLRERRAYVILKVADMVEESEQVSERIEECVQYLRRDEEGEEEGSSDRKAQETYTRGMKQTVVWESKEGENYDDID